MHIARLVAAGALAAAASAAPISSASAHCWHHGCWHHRGPVVGVLDAAGAVVTGAVAIATAPVVLAADIVSAPFRSDDYYYTYGGGYYEEPQYGPRYSGANRYWKPYRYAGGYEYGDSDGY